MGSPSIFIKIRFTQHQTVRHHKCAPQCKQTDLTDSKTLIEQHTHNIIGGTDVTTSQKQIYWPFEGLDDITIDRLNGNGIRIKIEYQFDTKKSTKNKLFDGQIQIAKSEW